MLFQHLNCKERVYYAKWFENAYCPTTKNSIYQNSLNYLSKLANDRIRVTARIWGVVPRCNPQSLIVTLGEMVKYQDSMTINHLLIVFIFTSIYSNWLNENQFKILSTFPISLWFVLPQQALLKIPDFIKLVSVS